MENSLAQTGLRLSLTFFTVAIPLQANAFADYEHYYVGIDARENITSGSYAELANPNYNRLTFLFAHFNEDPITNHFHSLGSYSYTGELSNLTIIDTNTNNRIPEYFTGLPPLTLVQGNDVFANKLISKSSEEEYSNLTIKAVQSLLDAGETATEYLYNSSEGRWQGLLGEAAIALELVSLTPGLNVADSGGVDLFDGVGDNYLIGEGDDFFFLPTFYTAKSAATGQYSATFRLVDLNSNNERTPLAPSGTFSFDFQVEAVPEPSLLLGLGLLGGLILRSYKKN